MFDNSLEGVILCDNAAQAGASGTGEQVIKTFSLPANSLQANGQALRIRALFKHAANTNNVTFKLYFGSESISSGTLASSGELCELNAIVVRRGVGSQMVWMSGKQSASPAILADAYTAASEDETAAIVIKATLQGGTSGVDGEVELLHIEFLKQP